MMKRLLVTGGSSYLGRHFIPLVPEKYDLRYTFFQNDPLGLATGCSLDLRDSTAVSNLIKAVQPNCILHFAGSNRPDDMAAVIRQGTQHIVSGAAAVGARLIHLSTDSIFNGKNPPYDESAVPTPVNEYGRAKADAEAMVQTHPNHVIVRTSLIYGLKVMDHGTAWMSSALQQGKGVTLFENQVRNPVWVDTLCCACLELIEHPFRGIINIAGNQVLTRADFAIKMFDYWNIAKRENITIGRSAKDRWPLDCQLTLLLAEDLLQTPLPGVDTVLSKSANHQP